MLSLHQLFPIPAFDGEGATARGHKGGKENEGRNEAAARSSRNRVGSGGFNRRTSALSLPLTCGLLLTDDDPHHQRQQAQPPFRDQLHPASSNSPPSASRGPMNSPAGGRLAPCSPCHQLSLALTLRAALLNEPITVMCHADVAAVLISALSAPLSHVADEVLASIGFEYVTSVADMCKWMLTTYLSDDGEAPSDAVEMRRPVDPSITVPTAQSSPPSAVVMILDGLQGTQDVALLSRLVAICGLCFAHPGDAEMPVLGGDDDDAAPGECFFRPYFSIATAAFSTGWPLPLHSMSGVPLVSVRHDGAAAGGSGLSARFTVLSHGRTPAATAVTGEHGEGDVVIEVDVAWHTSRDAAANSPLTVSAVRRGA